MKSAKQLIKLAERAGWKPSVMRPQNSEILEVLASPVIPGHVLQFELLVINHGAGSVKVALQSNMHSGMLDHGLIEAAIEMQKQAIALWSFPKPMSDADEKEMTKVLGYRMKT